MFIVGGHGIADVITDRHKPDRHRHQENHQPEEGKNQSNENLEQPRFRKMQNRSLKHRKEDNHQEEGFCDFPGSLTHQMPEVSTEIRLKRVVRKLIADAAVSCSQAQCEYCENRSHGAKCNQPEAVFLRISACKSLGNAQTECHDKRNRNRPGRNSARIKRQRQQRPFSRRNQQRSKRKQKHIEEHQQRCQVAFQHNPDHGKNQKQTDANAHGHDKQRRIDYRTHLSGQHGKIRLRNRNQDAQQKAHRHQNANFLRFCKSFPHMLSHRHHGKIRSQIKKADPDHQQKRADDKNKPVEPGKRCKRGKGNDQDQPCDRHN